MRDAAHSTHTHDGIFDNLGPRVQVAGSIARGRGLRRGFAMLHATLGRRKCVSQWACQGPPSKVCMPSVGRAHVATIATARRPLRALEFGRTRGISSRRRRARGRGRRVRGRRMGMERRGAASLRCVRGERRGGGACGNGGGRGGVDARVCMARIMWADERSGGVWGVVGGARATAWGAGAARRGEARGAPRVARLRRAAAVAGATRLRGVGGAWRCVAGGWWRWWDWGCGRRSRVCWARWRVCGGGECVCGWVVADRVKRVTRSGCGGGRARVVAARCGRCVMGVPRGV